jgi:ankyrin repeat protein
VLALVKDCGADAITANKNGDTPVMVALENGHWDTKYGHATTKASCLHYAAVAPSETEQAEEQCIKVAGAIMERGGIDLLSQADFHSGLTPLDCAVYVGKEVCVCLLLQDLLQSCSRGGRRRVEDMCYERRRAEACVDESAHHALVNAVGREIV